MNSLTGTESRGAGDGAATAAGMAATGYDQLAAIRERGPSAVGVAGLLDMEIDDLGVGHGVFTATTRPAFGNPLGTLHGGITATLLDSAMTCAVMSALPAGVAATTLDLSVRYLRPAPLDGTRIWAVGDLVHQGRTVATAEGRLVDERDRLIATATTTCLVVGGTKEGVR